VGGKRTNLLLGYRTNVGIGLNHGVLKTRVHKVGLVGTRDDASGDDAFFPMGGRVSMQREFAAGVLSVHHGTDIRLVVVPSGDVGEVQPVLESLAIAPLKAAHAHVRQVLDPLKVGRGHAAGVAENVTDDAAPVLEHVTDVLFVLVTVVEVVLLASAVAETGPLGASALILALMRRALAAMIWFPRAASTRTSHSCQGGGRGTR
jgi:hypothetical protein